MQVSWTIANADTRSRELKGLLKAAAYCHAPQAWIITAEEEEEFEIDGVKILVIPAWKWLLTT
ncbi:hypothetical protein [Sphingobacterium pedocola]|uniref:Uncharacterized protein n=1 Tax=Sphingobacterium pedocola TaxID=2082722 RepID=A0ABR9T9L9_9SPHI|nr:hypothetical protein [Sphingobacterium pedocola]MBE8722036.1 hypothetical protein [Sphingobacterium pedocola]